MRKLFGTDGIRGRVDEYPMTEEMVARVGSAISSILIEDNKHPKVLIGRDTRESGERLEKVIISGICKLNGKAYLAGIIPTPGVSYLVSSNDFDAGIVISASHNPYQDNGIKIFNSEGCKLSDDKEVEIEKLILSPQLQDMGSSKIDESCVYHYDKSIDDYSTFLKTCIDQRISFMGMKLVIDCAHGSTCVIAPKLFEDLGANVEAISIAPDGKNINANCGSEHPEVMRQKLIERHADMGVAFDGDGDRLIVADETGDILSGDQLIAIFASFLKNQGMLSNNSVVSTIMSNVGLGIALRNMDIEHVKADVGDRYVFKKMIECGAILGGENSGHIILMDSQKTGDGLVSALRLLEIMRLSDKPISELKKCMTVYPQALINIDVKHKPDLQEYPEIIHILSAVEERLGKEGRVLVRYSGTQPICRIMVEGPNADDTNKFCQEIAEIINKNVNKGALNSDTLS